MPCRSFALPWCYVVRLPLLSRSDLGDTELTWLQQLADLDGLDPCCVGSATDKQLSTTVSVSPDDMLAVAAFVPSYFASELDAALRTPSAAAAAAVPSYSVLASYSDMHELQPQEAARVAPQASHLKLYDIACPEELPRGGLQACLWGASLACWLPWLGEPATASGALRPGCTLVTLDSAAVVAANSADVGPPPRAAEQLAAALLTGPERGFFRAQKQFAVASGGQVVLVQSGVVVSVQSKPAGEVAMPQLFPLAVVCTQPARLRSAGPMPASGAINARVHGRTARCPPCPRSPARPPACPASHVAHSCAGPGSQTLCAACCCAPPGGAAALRLL